MPLQPAPGEKPRRVPLTVSIDEQRLGMTRSLGDLYATLSPSEREAEQKKMNTWTSIWCCSTPLGPKKPGHIWYDFFWDVVPHTNRHQKLVTAPWEPNFGP